MLTTLLLLAISLPRTHACESAAVERPGLALSAPSWGFIVRTATACEPTIITAAELYALGVDPAAPVEVSEVDADIFQEEP